MGIFSSDERDDYPTWLILHPMYSEIMELIREYNKAVLLPHVKKPKAYALYQMWEKVDATEKENENE